MEPRQPGNPDLPDFNELNDRIIAPASKQPTIVIKTNLDKQDSTVDNPYFKNAQETDTKAFREFFEQ